MGFLNGQEERFVRTKWRDLDTFAQECFAIFSQNLAITPSQVTIEQPEGSTDPGLQINTGSSGGDGPIIQIDHGDQNFTFSPGDFGPGGGFNGGDFNGGSINFGDIQWPGQDPANKDAATPDPSNPPIVLYGEVQSQVSDNVYTVKVWARSPSTAPEIGVINVRAPGLDTADIIPSGYPVTVIAFPGEVLGVRTIEDAVMTTPLFAAPAT